MPLNQKYQSILWEYDLSNLEFDNDIVIERLLNLWNKNLTDEWINIIWKEKAKELFIKNSLKLDKKSLNYWNIIFWTKITLDNNSSMYEKLNKPIFSRNFG